MNSHENLKEPFLEVLEKNLGVVSSACKQVGISRGTFYNWKKADEDFAKRVKEISEVAIDFAESQLFKQIEGGDTTAIIFFLKTRGKERGYNEKTDIRFDTDNNLKIEIIKT